MVTGKSAQTVSFYLWGIRHKLQVKNNEALMHYVGEWLSLQKTPLQLSPKEEEILQLALKGCTIPEIAQIMKISESGVNKYREKIYAANDCHSIIELIAKYYGTYENDGFTL